MPTDAAVPCGIAIPQVFPDSPVDMGLIKGYVRKAENLGYESLWVQEQIIGVTPNLEPLSLLAYVAAVTEKIRLGTAVLILTTRNPVLLAKQLSSLDRMSGGRLIVGIGLGGRQRQYSLLGAPSERRVRHFVESLAVMRALWEQPEAGYRGQIWDLDAIPMEPKPMQEPRLPVWFGGRHPDALRRAVRHGDGWMGAGSTTTEQFKEHVGIIKSHLAESGRDPATFPISKRVYVAVDDDADRAESRLRDWFAHHYGNADLASEVAVWGSVTRCIEGLNEVTAGGAQMLMLNPAFDHMEHLETLRHDVMPRLQPA